MSLPLDPLESYPPREENENPSGPNYISTSSGKKDGLDKCPKCGSTEVTYRMEQGLLTCLHCRHSWSEARLVDAHGLETDLTLLSGLQLGTGADALDRSASSVVTLKCGGCGAEVVIDSATNVQARCHWCRQVLSLNEQVPNGAVPDAVLPFTLSRDEAVKRIHEFAGKREFFAARQFKKEFKPENVVGVFLPYMVIDGSLSAELSGQGEIETRRYQVGSGNNKRTVYDADVYALRRAFQFTVDDLTVEASAEKSDMNTAVNSHNVINTILPFPTKDAVEYNSNYLGEYTAEKRDLDVQAMTPRVMDQLLSIARSEATKTGRMYDRGIRWESEYVEVHGSRWLSLYLPVWLYSYMDENKFLHYIAVNGRTGETMGSVPVNKVLLAGTSVLIGAIVTILVALGLFGSGWSSDPEVPPATNFTPAESYEPEYGDLP